MATGPSRSSFAERACQSMVASGDRLQVARTEPTRSKSKRPTREPLHRLRRHLRVSQGALRRSCFDSRRTRPACFTCRESKSTSRLLKIARRVARPNSALYTRGRSSAPLEMKAGFEKGRNFARPARVHGHAGPYQARSPIRIHGPDTLPVRAWPRRDSAVTKLRCSAIVSCCGCPRIELDEIRQSNRPEILAAAMSSPRTQLNKADCRRIFSAGSILLSDVLPSALGLPHDAS